MAIPLVKRLNRRNLQLHEKPPVKVVQFGEGNFLRAFVNDAFQQLNKTADFNAGVAVVQPIEQGLIDVINDQDGLYTLFLNGYQHGAAIQHNELITNIVQGVNPYTHFQQFLDLAKEDDLQFVISNTTESGIAYVDTDTIEMRPPSSFPAKLTVLLYERFKHFNGAAHKGLTIIPCELINHNAATLKEIILKYMALWNLENAFKTWVLNSCSFHNTLVDRIVPGFPRDNIDAYNQRLDYVDTLIVTAETFFLWVIEGDKALQEKLPFHKTDLNVKIVNDMQPYRTRKVRILNGAHTAMVPLALLYGQETVKETIDDAFTGDFVNNLIFNEIYPTLPLEESELQTFAHEVLDRFRNPFIRHRLADIALNTISKFEVRVLPSLLAYHAKTGKLPTHICFAFACLIRFYKGIWQEKSLPVHDSAVVVAAFKTAWQQGSLQAVTHEVLKNATFWGQDLTRLPHLLDTVTCALEQIELYGIEKGFENFKTKY